MNSVFVSWSGGKDSCFAGYLAKKNGLEIKYLLNMGTEDGRYSRTHRISTDLLKTQAQATGIPLLLQRTADNDYEKKFIEALHILRDGGITGGVFGDIDIQQHRDWVERVCSVAGITPYLPLWGKSQDNILKEFVTAGFETIVIVTRADLLGKEWLNRKIDAGFIADLHRMSVTPCGETGEYHTLVIDGPLFHQRLELMDTSAILHDGYWFLDINKYTLADKQEKPIG